MRGVTILSFRFDNVYWDEIAAVPIGTEGQARNYRGPRLAGTSPEVSGLLFAQASLRLRSAWWCEGSHLT
jgi:hypothetical protein